MGRARKRVRVFASQHSNIRRVPVVGQEGEDGPLSGKGDAADEELGAMGGHRAGCHRRAWCRRRRGPPMCPPPRRRQRRLPQVRWRQRPGGRPGRARHCDGQPSIEAESWPTVPGSAQASEGERRVAGEAAAADVATAAAVRGSNSCAIL